MSTTRLSLLPCVALACACSTSTPPPEFSDDAAPADAATVLDAAPSPDGASGPSETNTQPCGDTLCRPGDGEAERVCVRGVCELRRCLDTHQRCDDRCLPITPSLGCGSPSCAPCPPVKNGRAVCAGTPSRCAVECDDGAVARDGACLRLPPARPVSPANGASAYARVVRLCATGGLVIPSLGHRIEILDPYTGAVLHTSTVMSECAEVPSALAAPGRTLAWRVRSFAGDAVGAPSPIWRFRLEPRADEGSLARGASSFDGASAALPIGTREGSVALLRGARDLRDRPAMVILPAPDHALGAATFALLDANGDGRAEFVRGAPSANALFRWVAPMTTSTPEVPLPAPASAPSEAGFGTLLAVGSFSTGFGDDLAVGSARWDRVVVYMGLASTARATTIPVGSPPIALAAGGVTGGSYDDLVVATRERLQVFRAAPEGVRTSAASSVTWNAPPLALAVGDVIADGFADVVTRDAGGVRVYRGGAGGVVGPIQTIAAPGGATLECADLTGDRVADCALLVGGELRVHRGGSGGLSLTPTLTRSVAGVDQGMPLALVARDLDGDGLLDVAVLSQSADEATVLVYTGVRGGLANEPVVIRAELKGDVLVGPMR